jgi:RNA polymerase sigma-70 factor (ECF subfamily)
MLLRRKKNTFNLDDFQPEDAEETPLPEVFVDWTALPEDELLSSESKNALEAAMKQLPASLSMVFYLRDIEGISIKETAEILDLTETNVKTRLLRARMFLREKLSTYYSERMTREETHD